MAQYLQKIIDSLQEVRFTDLDSPAEAMGEKDHVVGVMSDDAKRLYVWRSQHQFQIDELACRWKLALSLAMGRETSQIKAFQTEGFLLSKKLELINNLLWGQVRDEFPELSNHAPIGLRTKWQVVWTEEDPMLSPTMGGIILIGPVR